MFKLLKTLTMTKNRLITTALVAAMSLGAISCKDQLDVGNPNSPSATPKSENAILQLATGGVYWNGLSNGDGWLGNSYFSLPMGYNELLADNVGASASNNQVTTIAQPAYIILDDGTKRLNTSPTTGIIRTYNNRASTGGGNNALHYQWLNMYALNNAMNNVLSIVEGIDYPTDAADKIATISAWCYFWKGFAYSSIGTKYVAGLIVNEYGEKSSNYVSHDVVVAEGDKFYDLAASTLDGISDEGVYSDILGKIIPSHMQTGLGNPMSIDEFKRFINTMKARNLMYDKLAPYVNGVVGGSITGSMMSGAMTAADWDNLITLTKNGIRKGDNVLTGRTIGFNDFFTAGGGTVAVLTANPARTSTFKPSERSLQNFKVGDKRFTRNFVASDAYSNDYVYGVRYSLLDHNNVSSEPAGVAGAWIYANKAVGEFELYLGATYEENDLMLAEALIRKGGVSNILDAVTLIDGVRSYMGAGLTALATGPALTQAQAMKELSMEKRVAMLYRGVSFYDHRRWGWTYDIANGGGSYGNTVVLGSQINTNVTINYAFMDYWDVPANEIVLNPADGSSAPVVNPNFN